MRFSTILAATCLSAGLAGCETVADRPPSVRPINKVQPVYPPEAERRGLSGRVDLDCQITETGSTKACVVMSASDPIFVPGALDFVARARYSPALHDGVPVAVLHHTFAITYRLGDAQVSFNARCDVQPSGVVINCRPERSPPPALWPVAKATLEHVVAVPSDTDGHPVDSPDRAVTISIASSKLPLAGPAPKLQSDAVVLQHIACDREIRPPPAEMAHCRGANTDGSVSDGMIHYRVYVGFTGIVPQSTGDFSQ